MINELAEYGVHSNLDTEDCLKESEGRFGEFPMSGRILPIPRIPDGLRRAAQRGRLIIFVGAGCSKLAGCPDWSEFADAALRALVQQGKFSHGQLAQVSHLHPRVKLSIARRLQKERKTSINFRSILHPSGKANKKGRRLYANLAKLANKFVTTNYDEWLDEPFDDEPFDLLVKPPADSSTATTLQPRTVIYRAEEIIPSKINNANVVIHLHGSVKHPDGMILTTQDYVRHYANDRGPREPEAENRILTFLDYLFREKTVLFVGYGLNELEILEYIITKAKQPQSKEPVVEHYLIQDFFLHEQELARNLEAYYRESGIQLIPFSKDQKGWEQLLDVVERFARDVRASELVLEDFVQMEGLLDG